MNQCLIDALLHGDGCTILLSTHLLGDLGVSPPGWASWTTDTWSRRAVEDWQRTMRRVQVVFAGDTSPRDFAIPGALRSTALGPVVTALARVTDDTQLDGIRNLPGAQVYVSRSPWKSCLSIGSARGPTAAPG